MTPLRHDPIERDAPTVVEPPQGPYEVWALADDGAQRILALIAAGTWPDGWDGTEPAATVPLDKILRGGAVQPLLGLEET